MRETAGDTTIRILHVDDDSHDRELVCDALEKEHGGFSVVGAASKEEFEALLEAGEFDLVLTDFNISGFEGLQVLETVHRRTPQLPVIVVTGTGSEEVAVEAMKRGAADYVIKTTNHIRRLPVVIHAVLQQRALEEEHRQVVEALRESETLFRTLTETISAGIYIYRGFRYCYLNSAAEVLAGYPRDELLSMDVWEPIHPDYRERVKEYVLARQAGEPAPTRYETKLLTKTGREKWVDVTAARIDYRGASAVLVMAYDITERKVVEQALEAERELLAVTLRSITDGIIVADPDGRVVLANPAGREYLALLTDASAGTVLTHLGGRPIEEFLTPPRGGVGYHEVILKSFPRRVFEVQAHSVPSRSEFRGRVWVIRDATQERHVQDQLHQQSRLAAVGQLAAGIAHDFNNLLTGMIGFADLLKLRSDIPESAKGHLGQIVKQGERATYLIRQILDFSRESVSQLQPLDLVPLVKETTKFLERTIPESIRIELDIDPGEHIVNADATKIQQMLTNLAVNARDAMPTGGTLWIGLSRFSLLTNQPAPIPGLPSDQWTILSMTDTGEGIPIEIMPRIFDPFFTTKDPGKGTGLGLSQVYGIVKQHEGFIDVKSQVGHGASFLVYLPSLAVSEPGPGAELSEDIPQGQGETILLVEDEKPVLEAGTAMLQSLNYRVLTATNGRDALSVYADYKNEIALVLTDMLMPDMDGMALVDSLKGQNQGLSIIMLTGYPVVGENEQFLARKEVDWLAKPVRLGQLARSVHRCLTRSREGSPIGQGKEKP